MAAESAYVKTNIMGVIQLRDGTGTPVTLNMSYDKGDLSCGPLADKLNEEVAIERRGKFVSLAHAARIYPDLSFTAFVGNIVGSSTSAPGTPTEFLTKLGAYSANVSTLGSGTAMPYTVDVRLTIEGTNFGDTADETFTAEDVRCRISFSESADGYSISVTGKVYGSVIAVNSANTVTFAQIS
jgi:hypothetical protein